MQVNPRIIATPHRNFKQEEITRHIWLGAVIVNSNLWQLKVFPEVEAEPLDRHYQAQPGK